MLNLFLFHDTKKSKQIRGFVKKTRFTTTTWGFTIKPSNTSPVFPSFFFSFPAVNDSTWRGWAGTGLGGFQPSQGGSPLRCLIVVESETTKKRPKKTQEIVVAPVILQEQDSRHIFGDLIFSSFVMSFVMRWYDLAWPCLVNTQYFLDCPAVSLSHLQEIRYQFCRSAISINL